MAGPRPPPRVSLGMSAACRGWPPSRGLAQQPDDGVGLLRGHLGGYLNRRRVGRPSDLGREDYDTTADKGQLVVDVSRGVRSELRERRHIHIESHDIPL